MFRIMWMHGCIHTTQTQTTITTQLNEKPWRRPLTMGHQRSEMTAQYTGEPEAISRVIPHSGNPQLPTLADHFSDGPTKVKTSYIFNSHVGNAIQNFCIKLISLCIYWASIFRILYCTPPYRSSLPPQWTSQFRVDGLFPRTRQYWTGLSPTWPQTTGKDQGNHISGMLDVKKEIGM